MKHFTRPILWLALWLGCSGAFAQGSTGINGTGQNGGGGVNSVTGAGTVACTPTTGSVVCTGSGSGATSVTGTNGVTASPTTGAVGVSLSPIAGGNILGCPTVGTPCAPGALAALPTSVITSSTVFNTVNYTCGNVSDSAGIATAVATGQSVHLSGGNCALTSQVTLTQAQCLYGDGPYATLLNVSSNFSSSATAVISLGSSNTTLAPCVHDLAVNFSQPPALTTTTSAAQASGTTIQTSASIPVNYYVNDTTTTTAIPSLTYVTAVSGTGPYTLTLSGTVTGVLNGDSINANANRAGATTLSSGCNVASGGNICEYPPAIQELNASTRPYLYNLMIQGAWAGLDFTGGSVVNTVPWIDDVWVGGLSYSIRMDGGQDFSHIKGFHVWEFGWNGNDTNNAWHDGSTYCAQIGREDTLNVEDFTCFDGIFQITANASNSETPSKYVNISLDSNQSQLLINGGFDNQFVNLNKTGSGNTCPIDVTAGITEITQPDLYISSGSTPYGCLTGGALKMLGGQIVLTSGAGGVTAFLNTGGLIDIENVYWSMPSTLSAATVSTTSGGTIFKGNVCHAGSSGTFLSVTADATANDVEGNVCNGYTQTVPLGNTSGYYSVPSGTFGYSYNSGTAPTFDFWKTNGGANDKGWSQQIGGTTYNLLALTDANGGSAGSGNTGNAINITRNGQPITNISLGNSVDNPTLQFNSTGTASFGGIIGTGRVVISTGSAFGISGCSVSAHSGGQAAGQYTSGTSGTCAVTITLPTTTTAYSCSQNDTTTNADIQVMSASTTTSATITGTTVSGDVIKFSCTAGAY